MKHLIFAALYYLGLHALFRFFHRRSLTVVLYHGIAPAVSQGIYNYRNKFISPQAFAAQLEYFDRHYTVLPLEKALKLMHEGTLPPNTLSITFDDGYRNFSDFAYPLLSKRQMPATMFVATDFVFRSIPLWVDRLEYAIGRDDGTRAEKIAHDTVQRDRLKTLDPALREHDLRNIEQISFTQFTDFSGDREVYAPMDPAQMQPMQLNGITFGAHTRTHPILSRMTDAEQSDEIRTSREDLSNAGFKVSSVFAYPNGHPGDWNASTEAVLRDQGFTHALTTIEGFNDASTPVYALRRMVLDGSERFAVFANIVSGVRLFVKSIV